MNKYFLIFVAVFILSAACVTTQTKNAEQEVLPPLLPPIVQKSPLPQPKTAKDPWVDWTKKIKLKTVRLSKMPLDVRLAFVDYYKSMNVPEESPKWAEKILFDVGDHDFNRDGIAEKLMILRTNSSGEKVYSSFYIFKLENRKWKQIILSQEFWLEDSEIIPSNKKNEFDVIKIISHTEDGDGFDYFTYFRLDNGQYAKFECRDLSRQTITCPE